MTERRQRLHSSWEAFESWRNDTLNRLCVCVRLGNMAERNDPSKLSDAAALALRWRECAGYFAGILADGSAEAQVQLWKERTGIDKCISGIIAD